MEEFRMGKINIKKKVKTFGYSLFIGLLSICLLSIGSIKVNAATKFYEYSNQTITGYTDYAFDGTQYPANYSNCGDYRVGFVAVLTHTLFDRHEELVLY
jgi:hypothetical protein